MECLDVAGAGDGKRNRTARWGLVLDLKLELLACVTQTRAC